jgi:hypothetical protein
LARRNSDRLRCGTRGLPRLGEPGS